MDKPSRIFGRAREWDGLAAFATRPVGATAGGASLGVVSGRRRQGKSFLLQALAEAAGGLYFAATEATEAESLRLFTEALTRHTREVVRAPFRDWNDAIAHLFHSVGDRPTIVAIDEFPFLSKSSPALPSIIQRELGPGGSGRTSSARLVLCGSAMSVMGGLLAGQAPLRGRASLELIVQPFRHRESAEFWGITDPRLAVLVHAVVGGTPAYRNEFTQGDAPDTIEDFDAWVIRTALNPQTPLFREARYLLAEEAAIRDPALYHSVLAAIATGHNTNGGIANFIGRKTDHITHPLNVLEDCALISREPDLLRSGRVRYRIVEPLITFYESIMRNRWAELEIHRAEQVWTTTRQTFLTQVVGPHFEALCRAFVLESGGSLFAEHPAEVGSGTVNDPANRTQIEIDVVALSAPQANSPRRILSLGEVKWGEVIGHHHLQRLATARDLLRPKGYDTDDTVLALYGGNGFTAELEAAAVTDDRILLVDLSRLYS
ncbi:AAA+ ATPase superfamily predicted ATPase [Catenuloplanes nepalensis]|uniref:AAA+ ATPase superfamily predicted ATPase n=1 Tax=Catenuloplanes nepalensis TaxID=587533 RepID=A0ABT9MP84_9ACTN|nr:ATP-binding protein [Catenuloplanes nepalensis]MDP9793225.1 AAA+ ATPase superfamily predicted ATPase [Catenuloplanes nepalensis]